MRHPRSSPLALLPIAVLAVLAPPASAAGSITISGSLSGPAGARVVALGTDGRSIVASPGTGGTFRVRVPGPRLAGVSLQVLGADGRYLGPVVLASKGASGATRLRRARGSSLALGRVNVLRGYARLRRALPAGAVESGSVRLVKGAPAGAGRLGYVKLARASAAGATAGTCTSSGATESAGGGDCDKDGIPNVVDVDDNGNGTLDAVDPKTAQTTAKLALTFSLRPPFVRGLNVYAGADRSAINAYLGGTADEGGLNMGFWLRQESIDPTAQEAFRNVWLTCPASAPWCAPGTAKALFGGNAETPPLEPGADRWALRSWFDFHGAGCDSSVCTPAGGSDPNSLIGMRQNSGQGGKGRPVWTGSVRPGAADTLASVVPGDVLTLNTRAADGTVTTRPMTVSPYFVTAPALASYGPDPAKLTPVTYPVGRDTPGAYHFNAITAGDDGKFTVRFWRPQRFALPGESGQWYDVSGLRWGAFVDSYTTPDGQYRNAGLGTCPITDPVGLVADGAVQNGSKVQLRDTTAADAVTDPAGAPGQVLGFTVDLRACMAAAGAPTDSGISTQLVIDAQSESVDGNANETGTTVQVRLP